MVSRLMQENLTLRERFENRLKGNEDKTDSIENRLWWILGIGAVIVFEIPLAVYFLTTK